MDPRRVIGNLPNVLVHNITLTVVLKTQRRANSDAIKRRTDGEISKKLIRGEPKMQDFEPCRMVYAPLGPRRSPCFWPTSCERTIFHSSSHQLCLFSQAAVDPGDRILRVSLQPPEGKVF